MRIYVPEHCVSLDRLVGRKHTRLPENVMLSAWLVVTELKIVHVSLPLGAKVPLDVLGSTRFLRDLTSETIKSHGFLESLVLKLPTNDQDVGVS
jgi:hypothetical protein